MPHLAQQRQGTMLFAGLDGNNGNTGAEQQFQFVLITHMLGTSPS